MARTLIEIDRGSNEPLYRQVRRVVEHGIAVGIFDSRRRLPSSRELAAELKVSRNTINLAYQELLTEGLVLSHERRGIFVNPEMVAAAEADVQTTDSMIDWSSRMRRYADEGVPEVERRPTGINIHTLSWPVRSMSRAFQQRLGCAASGRRFTSPIASPASRTVSARTIPC